MAEIITMPKMSDTMTEGVVAEWLKKVGDVLKTGDGLIAEIETDKATMELDLDERMDLSNFKDCRLLYIGLEKGKAVPVDSVIAIIGENGEAYEHLLGGNSNAEAKAETTVSATDAVVVAPPVLPAKPSVDISTIKAEIIGMPKMSDTMEEGTLVAWLKKVGDVLKPGDTLLAEVETDKATMEFELDNFLDVAKYNPCTLLYIGIEAGNTVPVDAVIAIIGEPGADFQALLGGGQTAPSPAAATEIAPATVVVEESNETENVETSSADARLKASPLAKALAKDKGINISEVKGSGENGRIVKADIDNFVPVAPKKAETLSKTIAAPAPNVILGEESYEDIPLNQMRKTIAVLRADNERIRQLEAKNERLELELKEIKNGITKNPLNSRLSISMIYPNNDDIPEQSRLSLGKLEANGESRPNS
jgi:pyruvate dehydrogenase E2 component (dihydrolipoamide acetyltransferase)